ncbi:hypothetical protein [Flavilitoribacter nigricans]|uniref:Periplasmic heavy metal sensor n=1 Tax=Flavilitoribacter nigricans (strain ATCC 23147 / DSM 23189 / NBRC 102662 / NCIMB 1420 / SS-2) TaxID=1122177 RepID=A0A2D0NAR8_FLAN2|nr:hypothetical protein [Flavilitoribacter nigricans]PHN05611.1 hypothetical protein CRP01_16625 [Flavilitoribacter nigricans DSM 23189 = NBRC 102662]
MKKTLQLFFSLAILSLASLTTYAQGGPGGGRMGGRGMMDPEQRVERQATMMQDSLELTDELTAEVKEVLSVYAKKMQEARAEANGDWGSMRTTMQTLREEQNQELEAVLGEEKWTQWEAISAEMMQRRQEMRGERRGEQGKKKGKKKDTRTE